MCYSAIQVECYVSSLYALQCAQISKVAPLDSPPWNLAGSLRQRRWTHPRPNSGFHHSQPRRNITHALSQTGRSLTHMVWQCLRLKIQYHHLTSSCWESSAGQSPKHLVKLLTQNVNVPQTLLNLLWDFFCCFFNSACVKSSTPESELCPQAFATDKPHYLQTQRHVMIFNCN